MEAWNREEIKERFAKLDTKFGGLGAKEGQKMQNDGTEARLRAGALSGDAPAESHSRPLGLVRATKAADQKEDTHKSRSVERPPTKRMTRTNQEA